MRFKQKRNAAIRRGGRVVFRQEPRRLTTGYFKRIVFLLGVGALIASCVYVLFFSPLLRIREVSLVGNKIVTNKEINAIISEESGKKVWGLIPRDSFLLFPRSRIADRLRRAFPLIASVSLDRQLPGRIAVTVAEYEPVLLWTSKGDWYVVDILGRAVVQISPEQAETIKLPVVTDELDQTFGLQETVASSQLVTFVGQIAALIPQQTNLVIRDISVPSAAAGEVHLHMTEGFVVYVDPTRDAADQVSILSDLLAKEIKDKRKRIQYIDLRVPNWAYYK